MIVNPGMLPLPGGRSSLLKALEQVTDPVGCQNPRRASDLGFYPRHSCSSASPTC
jgi:hypothetical protein